MSNSVSQYKHLVRVALLALPLLLLLGLNGRTVTLLRPAAPTGSEAHLSPRATIIKQRVVLEAASPLAPYVAAAGLAWLPAPQPASWLPRLLCRAVAVVPTGAPAIYVAQLCRQRLLGGVLQAQAP